MSSPQYVETLRAVDELGQGCHKRELTAAEFSSDVADLFFQYLANEDPRDDVMALVDYCLEVAREVCDLTLFADRVLPYRLEFHLRWMLDQQGDGETLAQITRRLRARLEADDELAKIELMELCQSGYDTHQSVFSSVDAERELIDLAYEFRVVAALDAAVRPTAPGRLANEDKSRGQALPRTLDLLAHLANDPRHPSGTLARDALVDLCGFSETAGMAALRLPIHILSNDQRERLHEMYVAHEDALGPETVKIFVSEEQVRDREILRSALWQANDARHFAVALDAAAADDV